MVGIRRGLGALIATAAVAALPASTAVADVGDLSFEQCLEDNDPGALAACIDVDGLDRANGAAVSPDGRSLYVTSSLDNAIVNFRRDLATGQLSFVQCFDDDSAGLEDECTDVPGLNTARQVTVTADSRSVLVASNTDDAIVNFDRNPFTGGLTFLECLDDNDSGTSAECDGVDGLENVFGVTASPNGRSVYAAANFDDAIVNFDRDPQTRRLTFVECFDDVTSGTEDACDPIDGLEGAIGVTVSPDGRSVYVGANVDHAVASFARNPLTGALEFGECLDDATIDHDAECTDTSGLNNPVSFASSLDSRSLYVGGGRLTSFRRDLTTGELSFVQCFDDADADQEAACAGVPALLGTSRVAVSADGRSVYASSRDDSVIDQFSRNLATGSLAYSRCVQDGDAGFEATCPDVAGLNTPSVLALSPDDASLYATADDSDSVVAFSREGVPEPAPPADTDPPETTIDRKPQNKVKTRKRKAKATFEFSADEAGSSFECNLDDQGFEPCTSPLKRKVKKGKHAFDVRATDAAGNTDQSPAADSWKVKRRKRR